MGSCQPAAVHTSTSGKLLHPCHNVLPVALLHLTLPSYLREVLSLLALSVKKRNAYRNQAFYSLSQPCLSEKLPGSFLPHPCLIHQNPSKSSVSESRLGEGFSITLGSARKRSGARCLRITSYHCSRPCSSQCGKVTPVAPWIAGRVILSLLLPWLSWTCCKQG